MKKYLKIELLGSIASIVALLFFLYYQFVYDDKPLIEVYTLSKDELTKLPEEEGLTVQYQFKNEPVKYLHKIKFRLINVGSKTIVGIEGGDLLENPLPIINHNNDSLVTLLNLQISDSNFPVKLVKDSSDYFLEFKQWKKDRYVEFVAYLNDENGDSDINGFSIDHTSILDAGMILHIFEPENKSSSPKLIDNFTTSFQNTLWWVVIIGYALMIIGSLPMAYKSGKEQEGKVAKIAFWILWGVLMVILIAPILWMINK